MLSEEVKKTGNCCCLFLFFIKLIELKCMHTNVFRQEPITRSLQLTHSLVTAFSQTDLFLV